MPNNWKDIHSSFTGMLQEQWEVENNFTYEQVKDWINIGLLPTDADFCGWLEQEGYTALAVLNYEDLEKLRTEYQQSLVSKPLFEWYSEDKITFQQFSQLSNHLGTNAGNDYKLTQLNNLLPTITPAKANYRYTKIILTVILLAGITYYLLKE